MHCSAYTMRATLPIFLFAETALSQQVVPRDFMRRRGVVCLLWRDVGDGMTVPTPFHYLYYLFITCVAIW